MAALSAALSLLSAGLAEAATYISSRSIGDGSVDISITTDGALGTLATANIVDWTFVLTRGGEAVTANSTNSTFKIYGGALSATATELLFDYASGFDRVRIDTTEAALSDRSWWCIQGAGQACAAGAIGAAEIVSVAPFMTFSFTHQKYSGVQAIASIGSAVPEPATWAMMIIGFGAVGSMVRVSRRRSAFSPA